ncbi:hypothetical protein EDC96DRAFT_574090 [Choanephora cucurbitarum]|nr:hypothetical protein EDC96DRAFT_574090 [Choanephora cucurbitarum]
MKDKESQHDAFISEANEKIVSIIAKETGFEGVQKPALESFANALSSYFERVFTKAHRLAELGNRTRPNIYDMARSLEAQGLDLNTFQQFLDHQSSSWTPFFKTQPKPSTLEKIPNFLPSDNEDSEEEEESEGGMPLYVPRHLPTFPSKHSFRQTPIYINRPDDPQKVRELNSEQSRTVEENLKKLMAAENKRLREQHKSDKSNLELL